MLKGIDKLLTGDLLKVLCDMGHGDELVIADADFPAETCAKRLIRLPDKITFLCVFNQQIVSAFFQASNLCPKKCLFFIGRSS